MTVPIYLDNNATTLISPEVAVSSATRQVTIRPVTNQEKKMKTSIRKLLPILAFACVWPVAAEEITYRKHIRPLWVDKCERCHGDNAPYLGEFQEDIKRYELDDKGPRMDTYADLAFFISWPDTGAIMRRLDDGKNTSKGEPGNMYKKLGRNEEERQANLNLFKQWVGEDAWTMKRPKEITKEELLKFKLAY